jgi:hypothetical protein
MKKQEKLPKYRSPYALQALLRRAGAFLDRKKEANKKKCRRKIEDD